MQSSLGTGPSTSELVMCMLVVMPLMVPSPLSPQPAGQGQGYVGAQCSANIGVANRSSVLLDLSGPEEAT